MHMSKVGFLLVLFRLFLETLAFVNFRYLYRHFDVSGHLITYATHSFCGMLFLLDLARHRGRLLGLIEKRTGIRSHSFVLYTLALGMISNAKSLLRLSISQCVSDTTAMALSCSSVLFTRFLFSGQQHAASTKMRCTVLVVAACMAAVILGEGEYLGCLCLLLASFISSLYSVLYRRMSRRRATLDDRIERLQLQKYEGLENMEKSRRMSVYLRSPLSQTCLHGVQGLDARPFQHGGAEDRRARGDGHALGTCLAEGTPGAKAPRTDMGTPCTAARNVPWMRRIILEDPGNAEHAEHLRSLYTTYYYLSLSGAMTAVLYWPLLLAENRRCWCPQYFLLVLLAVLLNALLNFNYFAAIGLVSTIFAQLSGFLFKAFVFWSQVAERGVLLQDAGALVVLLAVFFIC